MSDISPVDIRRAAMDFLARREHSRYELQTKLQRRFTESVAVDLALDLALDSVLDELAGENLQSDQRFAEAFVHQRSQRGYGPLRIHQEMREKGLSDQLVSTYLYSDCSLDWCKLARGVREKKFGSEIGIDYRDQAKQMRFLQHRGFDADVVRKAVQGRDSD